MCIEKWEIYSRSYEFVFVFFLLCARYFVQLDSVYARRSSHLSLVINSLFSIMYASSQAASQPANQPASQFDEFKILMLMHIIFTFTFTAHQTNTQQFIVYL